MKNLKTFFNTLKLYIKNKSLRWHIMVCVLISFFFMFIGLIFTMRLNFTSFQTLNNIYLSNSELNNYANLITETEKAMENYVEYHTFESIDTFFSNINQIQAHCDSMNNNPSVDPIIQKEFIVYQLSCSFIYFSGRTIAYRRANNFTEIEESYNKTRNCYNYLQKEIVDLNSLFLNENAKNYEKNKDHNNRIIRLSIIFLVTLIALIYIVLFYSIKSIIHPLTKISKVAHKVSKRNFDVPLFNSSSNDEIGEICNAFDRMIISIREYIDTIWEKARTEAELKEKEIEMQALYTNAQLKALQSQINPHFLFNTLNTGSQLAMMEGADKTCTFLERVADFFRYNIQQQNHIVTLDEELNLVDNFVYIMQVRFGSRLEFIKEIPDEKLNVFIPKMTLQPLVENCIKHGLTNTKGIVRLKIQFQNRFIEIKISDNGEGMESEIRENVLKSVEKGEFKLPDELLKKEFPFEDNMNKQNGTGLINVFSRLKLYYHKDNTFDILINDEGKKGTTFVIRIPN